MPLTVAYTVYMYVLYIRCNIMVVVIPVDTDLGGAWRAQCLRVDPGRGLRS